MYFREYQRYFDDMERERLVYYNGEYYKMRECYLSGGPYAVPRFQWDPYGPWRMARPVHHPMRYWTDLDYRYQHRIHEAMTQYKQHYSRNGYGDQIDGLMITPLGAEVSVKTIPIITITFGDKNFNYSVEIEEDKVYRIDYLADAKLSTIIGKVVDCRTYEYTDYRGKNAYYTLLKVDCSSDFGSDIRMVDSRDIRHICSLTDLQSNTSVTNTYIGITAPDDIENYGAWFNPVNDTLYLNKEGKWEEMPKRPTDIPEGKYYQFDIYKLLWTLKDIPPMPDIYRRGQVWIFDEFEGKWKHEYIAPKPIIDYPGTNEEVLPDCSIGFVDYNTGDKELYYNYSENQWAVRSKAPEVESGKIAIYNHKTNEWIITDYDNEEIINNVPEGSILQYHFATNTTGEYWTIESIGDPPGEDSEYYAWVYNKEAYRWYYSKKLLTYDVTKNTWSLEPLKVFNHPEETTKTGYTWKYSYFYNMWYQYPDSPAVRKLPTNINGELATLDPEVPVYIDDVTAMIVFDNKGY